MRAADIGHTLRVRVTASNATGPASATSAPTATVACSLTVVVRTITLPGAPGANRFALHFSGLKPGAYTLTVQVRAAGGRILSTSRSITIRRPRRTHG